MNKLVAVNNMRAYCNTCKKTKKITSFNVGLYDYCAVCTRKAEKSQEERRKKEERKAERTGDITFSQKVQSSRQWKALRKKATEYYGKQCHRCGDSGYGVEIHVDHIKPKSKYPELAFDPNNLQILCRDCNFEKGAKDETDYRPDFMY